MSDVPVLSGSGGIAHERAALTGRTAAKAQQEADALASIFSAGRLIIAPAELSEPLFNCLETALDNVLNSHGFLAAARRAQLRIDYQSPKAVLEALSTASHELQQFEALISAAVKRARQ